MRVVPVHKRCSLLIIAIVQQDFATVINLLTSVIRSCERDEPRQSRVFFKSSLWTDYCGEGSELVGAGSQRMLAVELAETFLSAELVELGGDNCGGTLVGRPGELGIKLQGRRTLGVAEATSNSV